MHSGATFVSGGLVPLERGSLQVQVHQKRTKDQIQGCTEAGDQTQTPVLPREDDIRDDGERVSFQRAGVLPSSQTSEHQESGQMVPHLEGQAQGVRSLSIDNPAHMDQMRQNKKRHRQDSFYEVQDVIYNQTVLLPFLPEICQMH